MDKKQMKELKNNIKQWLKMQPLCITDEQLQYLLEAYKEPGYVIGTHKSGGTHIKIFEEGLNNQDDLQKNDADLTNTVTPINNLASIGTYTHLGDDRNSVIIIKIPYKAFSGEEPLYKIKEDGGIAIPPEFILGSFEKDKIYHNENYIGKCKTATVHYDNDYSDDVIERYDKSLQQRQEECNIFLQAKHELEHPIKSKLEKIMSIFKRKEKTLQLPETTQKSTPKIICERVGEPELGDRIRYLEQNNNHDITVNKEEEK